jgi:hypothetical protein
LHYLEKIVVQRLIELGADLVADLRLSIGSVLRHLPVDLSYDVMAGYIGDILLILPS